MLEGVALAIRAAILLVDRAEQLSQRRGLFVLLTEGLFELMSEAPVHQPGPAEQRGLRRARRRCSDSEDEFARGFGDASVRDGCASIGV
ncbi:MAG: hypothetical protein NVSMB23_10020 [Myxococcales bacterium]